VNSSAYVVAVSLVMALLLGMLAVVATLNLVAGGGPKIGQLGWTGWLEALVIALPFLVVIFTVGIRAARVSGWLDGSDIWVRGIRGTIRVPVAGVERVEYLPYWTQGRRGTGPASPSSSVKSTARKSTR
jgi:hypothetical protein